MRSVRLTFGFVGLLVATGGCSQSFGALLYYMQIFPGEKVEAQFDLGPGPVAILVDDDQGLLEWPSARDVLADRIRTELLEEHAAGSILTVQEINAIRERDRKFNERSISELGEMLAVRRILWIQVRDFYASPNLEDSNSTARFIVRLKVFDPHAETNSRMRLWPDRREGHFVAIEKSAIEFQKVTHHEDAARILVHEMADQIARLFYSYRLES